MVFANVIATEFDDLLVGDDADNNLSSGAGNDRISGGLGINNLDGGQGIDTIDETLDADMRLTETFITIDGSDSQVINFEHAVLTGGDSNNILDASEFTFGSVILDGLGGDDVLTGTSHDDLLSGGEGADSLIGGEGLDTVIEERDADFHLSSSELTIGNDQADDLSSIEAADLTGGESDNIIDASLFHSGNVTIFCTWR